MPWHWRQRIVACDIGAELVRANSVVRLFFQCSELKEWAATWTDKTTPSMTPCRRTRQLAFWPFSGSRRRDEPNKASLLGSGGRQPRNLFLQIVTLGRATYKPRDQKAERHTRD